MTKINISVKGLDKVISDLERRGGQASAKVDMTAEKYARKMANEAGQAAPVKDNILRPDIIASPERVETGTWQFGSSLEYARRQEYEHRTKRGFIRRAVWNNRQPFRDEVRKKVVDKK